MAKLIVFDVDGTLINSANILLAAQKATCAVHGIEYPGDERALSIVGLSLDEAFYALFGPECPAPELTSTYKAQFNRLKLDPVFKEDPYPGIRALIEDFSRMDGVILGLATGKSARGVSMLLESQNWHGIFEVIRTADDCPSKPHPAMLLESMSYVEISPEHTIMIGDSSYDMAMARSAGCRAIGVDWGFHKPDALIKAGAHQIVSTTDALYRLAMETHTL